MKHFIEIKQDTAIIQKDTTYKISSKELKRILKIDKGEITSINLFYGRSPYDIENGKSADLDVWEINITEKYKEKP